ncbi:hypothetical protein B0H16DRAFT_1481454 [Mycena metata]|uniref:Uncharacterized protein n=1 Tax=Mycena metata TaxID=1033252 RepID=A0AAD7GYM2_9AGAR|nr:hypothetical protein B0H16DRAFT_1481454 [Mycena metata]
MTSNNQPAATSNHQRDVNDALVELGGAVDLMTAHVHATFTTQLPDLPNTLSGIVSACDAVHNALAILRGNISVAAAAAAAPPPVPTPAPTPVLPSFVRTTAPWAAGILFGVVPPVPLAAVPDNGGKWFAITRGQYIGLTQNGAISLNAVTGVSTGLSEKFNNQVDALAHFNGALASGALAVV